MNRLELCKISSPNVVQKNPSYRCKFFKTIHKMWKRELTTSEYFGKWGEVPFVMLLGEKLE